MKQSRKENCRIRNGEEAMDRIQEAGELIAGLIGNEANQNVIFACMDLEIESIEIAYELTQHKQPENVHNWIEPKRKILLTELKRRGLDQSEDAQCAFKKLDAVLQWVDRWEKV